MGFLKNMTILELLDKSQESFSTMEEIAFDLMDQCRIIYNEMMYYRAVAHHFAQKELDKIDRKFPIMSEHYQFLRLDWI